MSILNKARRWITLKAVDLAMRRPSPSTIPLSGEAVSARNYRTVHLVESGSQSNLVVRQIADQNAEGFWFENNGHDREDRSIPRAEWPAYAVHVREYYAEQEVRYTSALGYLVGFVTGRAKIELIWGRARNWLFALRPLVRANRTAVLAAIAERTIKDRDYRISAMDYATSAHSIRWVIHPEGDPIVRYYKLILDSLVASGDLNQRDGSYKLEPKALATLSAHEEDDRRHADNVTQQRWIIRLTTVLALTGIFQAYIQFRSP